MTNEFGAQARSLSLALYGRDDQLAQVDAVTVLVLVEVAEAVTLDEVLKVAFRVVAALAAKDAPRAREFADELRRVYKKK